MRRLDVMGVGAAILAAGGILYLTLRGAGVDSLQAGVWSQALLVGGSLGWIATYLFRVGTKQMTYHQQRRDYEEAVLQKRLQQMAPEDLERLQAEVERERPANPKSS